MRRWLGALAALACVFAIVIGSQLALSQAAEAAPAAGTPSGTSSTVAGCLPYYAVADGSGTGFICMTNVVQGVRTADPGVCTYAGFGARPTQGASNSGPLYSCIQPNAIVTGDLVDSQVGAAVCSTDGFGYSAGATVNGTSRSDVGTCTGSKAALPVTDGTSQGKLDTIAGKLDTLNSSVQAEATAAPAAAPASTVSMDPTQFGPLFWAILGGVSLLVFFLGVSTAKTLFGR